MENIKETFSQKDIEQSDRIKQLAAKTLEQLTLEKNNEKLNDQVNQLLQENNNLKSVNDTLKLKGINYSNNDYKKTLLDVRNLLQLELEKGIKKSEGIRINKTLSTSLINDINKALGEQL